MSGDYSRENMALQILCALLQMPNVKHNVLPAVMAVKLADELLDELRRDPNECKPATS